MIYRIRLVITPRCKSSCHVLGYCNCSEGLANESRDRAIQEEARRKSEALLRER